MADVAVKELLEAGLHFGHQTRRWNPRMRRYIFGERDGIHVIDLLQTEELLQRARDFVGEVAAKGGVVLFVGTKKQARDAIQEWAERCGMPYVNRRWLGGLLTNFNTIKQRISRLHELRDLKERGQLELLPTKERMSMDRELEKLEYNLGGVVDMDRLPDAVVIIDLKTEAIALAEAERLEIPIVALVDTNCDPTAVDYLVPGNDDAIRSCELVIGTLGEAIESGAARWRVQEQKRRADEERRRAEEEDRRRREEEERQRREEEERQRREAQEAAKAEAAAQAGREAQEAQQAQEAAAQEEGEQPAAEPRPQAEVPRERADDAAQAPGAPAAPEVAPEGAEGGAGGPPEPEREAPSDAPSEPEQERQPAESGGGQ
jgi:small subunit ribosomal protein S2